MNSDDFMPNEVTNRLLESEVSLFLQHENSGEENKQLWNRIMTLEDLWSSLQQNFEEIRKVSDPMNHENLSLKKKIFIEWEIFQRAQLNAEHSQNSLPDTV